MSRKNDNVVVGSEVKLFVCFFFKWKLIYAL